jgi:hypothetical protein
MTGSWLTGLLNSGNSDENGGIFEWHRDSRLWGSHAPDWDRSGGTDAVGTATGELVFIECEQQGRLGTHRLIGCDPAKWTDMRNVYCGAAGKLEIFI